MSLAAKASMLSAQVVPTAGGQTEWADMRAAYDDLKAALRDRLHKLSAHHSLRYSQAQIGHTNPGGLTYGFDGDDAPCVH